MLKFIKENKEFAIIFFLAVIIRFVSAHRYQYSYDELCGLRNSIYTNWNDLINYGVKLDTHPILVQLIINFTVSVFGYGEFWVKLPFLLFSLAAIVYAYVFSLKWYGKTAALITASIFSFSYIFLFYAPLARMYAGGLFFSTALTYYLFEICFSENKRTKHYVLFVLFILLCALNNHLSCLYAFTCAAFGLFFQKKETLVKYLAACFASVLLYLPHWPITIAQLGQGGIGHEQDGWLAAPDKWALFGFLRTLFGTGHSWIVFVVLLLTAFALSKQMQLSKRSVLLLLLFFVNYAIIHAYSVYKAPIFQYSVMLFSAPCFIWVITGVIKFNERITRAVVIIVCGVLIYQSVVAKHVFSNAVLNQNGFQAAKYVAVEDKYGKGKVESYFLGAQRYFVILYELKYGRRFNYVVAEDVWDISQFKERIKNSKAEYILLGEPDQTQLEIVKEYFPVMAYHAQGLNVNCYMFQRRGKTEFGKFETSRDTSTISLPGKYEYGFNKDKFSNGICRVDSLDEFCFSAKTNLKKLNLKEGNIVFAKIKLKSSDVLNDVSFNFSVSNAKDSTLFFGGPDLNKFYTADPSGYYAYTELFVGSELKNWLKQDAKLTFFIWNRGKKKFTISDLEIKTIDHWPQRWSWWE